MILLGLDPEPRWYYPTKQQKTVFGRQLTSNWQWPNYLYMTEELWRGRLWGFPECCIQQFDYEITHGISPPFNRGVKVVPGGLVPSEMTISCYIPCDSCMHLDEPNRFYFNYHRPGKIKWTWCEELQEWDRNLPMDEEVLNRYGLFHDEICQQLEPWVGPRPAKNGR